MRAVFTWYLQALKTRPLPTICVSSFFIHSCGDVLGQCLEQSAAPLNRTRVFIQACYGALYASPTSHFFLRWLNKRIPGRTVSSIVGKAAVSQLTYGPFIVASYLFIIAAANEKSISRGVIVMKNRMLQTAVLGFFVWTTLQTVNFWLVPSYFQVIYISCASVFWGAYLSYTRARASKATRLN